MSVPELDITRVFGETVRRRRLSLKISQEELADRAGLHRTYISDIERFSRNVTLRSAARVAHALETPLSKLLEGC